MNKLIECVPNFSEGRDLDKIDGIVDIMSNVDQVTILDVDPGADTNRTVVTWWDHLNQFLKPYLRV